MKFSELYQETGKMNEKFKNNKMIEWKKEWIKMRKKEK